MSKTRRFLYKAKDYLLLPAERSAFETLRAWLEGIALELKFHENVKNQLLIVADEIFTNIASYGYPSGEGSTRVAIEFNEDENVLKIIFIDSGLPYNPLATEDPDLTLSMQERQIGGLGIFLVKKLMDTVEYRRENDSNVLTLTKKLYI